MIVKNKEQVNIKTKKILLLRYINKSPEIKINELENILKIKSSRIYKQLKQLIIQDYIKKEDKKYILTEQSVKILEENKCIFNDTFLSKSIGITKAIIINKIKYFQGLKAAIEIDGKNFGKLEKKIFIEKYNITWPTLNKYLKILINEKIIIEYKKSNRTYYHLVSDYKQIINGTKPTSTIINTQVVVSKNKPEIIEEWEKAKGLPITKDWQKDIDAIEQIKKDKNISDRQLKSYFQIILTNNYWRKIITTPRVLLNEYMRSGITNLDKIINDRIIIIPRNNVVPIILKPEEIKIKKMQQKTELAKQIIKTDKIIKPEIIKAFEFFNNVEIHNWTNDIEAIEKIMLEKKLSLPKINELFFQISKDSFWSEQITAPFQLLDFYSNTTVTKLDKIINDFRARGEHGKNILR